MFAEKANSPDDLRKVAKNLLLEYNDNTIFAFYGKMGAGKTTFIQAICRELGSADNITSPTFAIVNEYSARNNKLIYHFDFYRIKDISEAFDLGYEDYFYSDNYCFIEWPERIEQLLPENVIRIEIIAGSDNTRTISTL